MCTDTVVHNMINGKPEKWWFILILVTLLIRASAIIGKQVTTDHYCQLSNEHVLPSWYYLSMVNNCVVDRFDSTYHCCFNSAYYFWAVFNTCVSSQWTWWRDQLLAYGSTHTPSSHVKVNRVQGSCQNEVCTIKPWFIDTKQWGVLQNSCCQWALCQCKVSIWFHLPSSHWIMQSEIRDVGT